MTTPYSTMFNQLNQITMKVKELRNAIAGLPDEWDVVMSDVDGKCLEIIEVNHAQPVVYLDSRQEFPEDWYCDGEEVRQVFGNAVCLNLDECEDDLEIEGHGEVRLQLHDGYAEGDGVRLEYPKLKDLTDEQLEEMDELLGGRILDSGVVVFSDVCLAHGKIVKPKEEQKKEPKYKLDRDLFAERTMYYAIITYIYGGQYAIPELSQADTTGRNRKELTRRMKRLCKPMLFSNYPVDLEIRTENDELVERWTQERECGPWKNTY